MMSDVNKWRDVTQNLRQCYVLLTFLYVKRVKTLNWNVINRLSHMVLVITLSINPQPYSSQVDIGSRVDTSGDNQNAVRIIPPLIFSKRQNVIIVLVP